MLIDLPLIWAILGFIGLIIYYFRYWYMFKKRAPIASFSGLVTIIIFAMMFGPITLYGSLTQEDPF